MGLTGQAPNQITLGQVYDLTQWFTPVNTNIQYFVNGEPASPPSSYIFPGQAGDSFTIVARDGVIENFENGQLSCRQSITLIQNSGCPISIPSQPGTTYYYDDTTYFEANTSGNPKTYKIGRYTIGQSTRIKSLFTPTTYNDPSTKYIVSISNNNEISYIVPGNDLNQNPYNDPAYAWNGNERFELQYYTDNLGEWSWEINDGVFSGTAQDNYWKVWPWLS